VDDNVGNYDVWVIVLPDGEPFTVFDQARQPNFGPDGRLLVNSENIPRGEHIGLIGTGYDWQGVVSDSPYDSHPFWSSDGSRYVYANDHLLFSPLFPDQYASYIFIPCSLRRPAVEETEEKCQDTRGQSKLVAGAYPVWTEDNRIAFTYYEAAEDGIYIVQANSVAREMAYGETPKPLVFGNGRASDTRGNQLFFSAGSLDQNWEAYAINLDGSNLINISNSPGTQDGLPTISPDGKWVAFVSDRDNHWGIWAVSIAGGPPVELVDLRRINTNPSPWGVGDREWITERISWGP
jgi:Tol biopolymer transport system component